MSIILFAKSGNICCNVAARCSLMNRAAEADKRTADLRQYTAGEAGQTKEQPTQDKGKANKRQCNFI